MTDYRQDCLTPDTKKWWKCCSSHHCTSRLRIIETRLWPSCLLGGSPRFAEVGGKYEENLLHFAVEYGSDSIVAELLVEQPHLVDILGEHGETVLHVAIREGHDKIVQQLLAHKPDLIDTKDSASMEWTCHDHGADTGPQA